ncbi:MAG: protein kinase, partial [Kiritimatiellae bacterium]|nr:protein kinase [Kiritimatiellia bacterium]
MGMIETMNDYQDISDDVTMGGNAQGTLLAGRYRAVRQLGQGGMGTVWLAEDTLLDDRQVAVKMLPSILVANKRAYNQLKSEALVALKLTHSNIVTLRAFEENGGNPFLVMDYVEGGTLDDYLAEKGTLTEAETVALLAPIAAALDYAHAKGVVHRDVKPANVMIRRDGTPFILDFGIAREIQETLTRVTGKLSSGTLLYMSPEQLHGAAPKAPQDVYSFAAMVYECLTGSPPFTRGDISDQIKNKTPDPLPAGIGIAPSVMAGLAKNPGGRPATCAGVLSGRGVASRGGAVTRRRGGGKSILVAAALLALIAGGGAWYARQSREASRARVEAAQRAAEKKRAEEEEARREAERGAAEQAAQEKAKAEAERLASLTPKAGDVKTVTLPGGAEMRFRWCPAGSFTMGSPASEDGRYDDEVLHRVTLTRGFWLGETEVTQRQWAGVMGGNPSRFKGGDNPVENVSWDDCQAFIRKVNAQLNCGMRLPTEAEWEYACRAGAVTAYFWGNILNGDRANCNGHYPYGTDTKGRYLVKTAPVGSYEP